jgi:hypothetical protein
MMIDELQGVIVAVFGINALPPPVNASITGINAFV